jgi:hypothetical protein
MAAIVWWLPVVTPQAAGRGAATHDGWHVSSVGAGCPVVLGWLQNNGEVGALTICIKMPDNPVERGE